MKQLSLLTWLTQLGLSVAVPLAGFVMLGVWLRERWNLGIWIVFLGVALGLYCAVHGFVKSLQTLSRLSKDQKNDHPISFQEHD